MSRFVRENFKFTGIDNLPKYWKPYFKYSTVGNTYEIIRDKNPVVPKSAPCKTCPPGPIRDLVMSNTEYEYLTNQPFFDICSQYTKPRVLSVGYGIGLIIPEMRRQGADLTIVEKYQEILDLDPKISEHMENHNIIVSPIEDLDISNLEPFDVIFSDITEDFRSDVYQRLSGSLKEGGQIYYWKHDIKIIERKNN